MDFIKKHIPQILSAWVIFVFVQSLFFKFSNSLETQHIFSTLDQWAAGYGAAGLFLPPGIFNQYVIGTAELIASLLLVAGLRPAQERFRFLGALLGISIMTGAIFFHLFTPLGIIIEAPDVPSDGGILFMMACSVWLANLYLVYRHRHTGMAFLCRLCKTKGN